MGRVNFQIDTVWTDPGGVTLGKLAGNYLGNVHWEDLPTVGGSIPWLGSWTAHVGEGLSSIVASVLFPDCGLG